MKRLYWYTSILVVGTYCSSQERISNHLFPTNFMFGAASSAYQTEGAWNESGKGVSIWDTYTHEKLFIANHSNGDVSADSYHLYKQDVMALKGLGVNFYRFAISWPRILPTGQVNVINQAGIDYYNNLINELKANDIEPMVTIYHWDLPQTLQDLGGWVNPVLANYFEDYSRVLYSNFGDRVKWWITMNEPNFIAMGYNAEKPLAPGVNAPGIGYYLSAHTTLQAHAKAYHLYDNQFRAQQKGKVGITLSSVWFEPLTNSTADTEAAEEEMQLHLCLFAHPIYSLEGDYPPMVRKIMDKVSAAQGYYRSRLRYFTPEEVSSLRGTHDFLGLNYYTARLVKSLKSLNDVVYSEHSYVNITVDPKWPSSGSEFLKVLPWGLRKTLTWVKKEYDNVPVIITENGFSDHGEFNDTGRIKYIVSHMSEIAKAIHEDGCDVFGYTYWSLLDSMEWGMGFVPKFGLFHVNFSDPNLRRIPKSSAFVFSEITRKRELPRYYLELTGELPSSTDKIRENQLNHALLSQPTSTCSGGIFFPYSEKFMFILSATVIYSRYIITS